jgi:hypothetical protein
MATTAQEIALMKVDIKTLKKDVKEINNKIDNLTLKLLDPDDGVVSRVNKNTRFRKSHDREMPTYNTIIDEFRELQRWKFTVTRALWGLYAGVVGYVLKLIFW